MLSIPPYVGQFILNVSSSPPCELLTFLYFPQLHLKNHFVNSFQVTFFSFSIVAIVLGETVLETILFFRHALASLSRVHVLALTPYLLGLSFAIEINFLMLDSLSAFLIAAPCMRFFFKALYSNFVKSINCISDALITTI